MTRLHITAEKLQDEKGGVTPSVPTNSQKADFSMSIKNLKYILGNYLLSGALFILFVAGAILLAIGSILRYEWFFGLYHKSQLYYYRSSQFFVAGTLVIASPVFYGLHRFCISCLQHGTGHILACLDNANISQVHTVDLGSIE